MAELIPVFSQQQGPLPVKTQVKIESDAPAIVTLSGSCWSPQAARTIGITLSIDGSPAATAWIFANQQSMHLPVVPVTVPYTFPWTEDQEHVFELSNAANSVTTSDSNDIFWVTVQF
jgi:hypothetical protein